jgi:hypothetical protein
MPGYNHIDLDEVHTPSRYYSSFLCFLGGPFVLFLRFAFLLRFSRPHVANSFLSFLSIQFVRQCALAASVRHYAGSRKKTTWLRGLPACKPPDLFLHGPFLCSVDHELTRGPQLPGAGRPSRLRTRPSGADGTQLEKAFSSNKTLLSYLALRAISKYRPTSRHIAIMELVCRLQPSGSPGSRLFFAYTFRRNWTFSFQLLLTA